MKKFLMKNVSVEVFRWIAFFWFIFAVFSYCLCCAAYCGDVVEFGNTHPGLYAIMFPGTLVIFVVIASYPFIRYGMPFMRR